MATGGGGGAGQPQGRGVSCQVVVRQQSLRSRSWLVVAIATDAATSRGGGGVGGGEGVDEVVLGEVWHHVVVEAEGGELWGWAGAGRVFLLRASVSTVSATGLKRVLLEENSEEGL